MPEHQATPIAVVGIACWYPDARNPLQLWENVLSRRRAFRRIPDCRLPLRDYYSPNRQINDSTYGSRAALIEGFEFDWAARRIPRSTVESTDIVHWLALEVALSAVADAGYDLRRVPGEAAGVIVGNTLTGEQTRSATLRLRWPFVRRCVTEAAGRCGLDAEHTARLEQALEARYKAVFPPVTEDTLAGGLSNTIAGRICHYLDLSGGGYTVDGACSSSLLAAATAVERLRQHDLDLALAGGVDVSLDPFELIGFAKTGALSDGEMRVYDRRADGFIPGEGCGFVVLRRLDDARRDGNRIYALIHGWGISSDGRGAGITAPSVAGQVRAIRRAFGRTPFRPSDLDFIEGHGTGTAVGDRIELAAIQQALAGDADLRPRGCGVTSLKSIIGHTKAASGIGGLIKTIMAVNRRIVPPTAGCREPHALFEQQAAALYPVLHGRRHPPERVLRAGVSSMGFGGINCHLTLASADPPDPRLAPALDEETLLAADQETELFVLAADSPAGLSRRAAELASVAEALSQAELIDLAAELGRKAVPGAEWRAAIVAGSPEELGSALDGLARAAVAGSGASESPALRWGRRRTQPLRLGMLFPGQGAQQLGMGRRIVQRYEWAREMLAAAEAQVGVVGGSALGHWMFRQPERARDADELQQWNRALARTEIAQPAICLSSALWLRWLGELGFAPAAVGGHSLGEITALHAAGAFDFNTLMALAVLRGRLMAEVDAGSGTMAALACDGEAARRLVEQAGGDVVAANRNSPRQTVISGAVEAVGRVLQAAAATGIQGRRLNVGGAFHSPRMAAAAARLRREAALPAGSPALPCRFFSALSGAEGLSGEELKDHLGRQIVAPVDFSTMLGSLAAAVDLLIEVGPGRVLSGLAADNLQGGGSPECLPVESVAGRDRDFNHLLAALYVNGADPRWEAVYGHRLCRPFLPPAERRFIVNLCERKVTAEPDAPPASGGLPEPVNPGLAARAGLSPAQWRAYLERRAHFLTQVIRADLDPDPSPALPAPAQPAEPEHEVVLGPGNRSADLAARLLALVHRATGFAPESISLQSRLLDDLNLDSIKAGDLLVRLAKEAGVRWPDHPSVLANASLEEVLQAVMRLQGTAPLSEPASGTPPLPAPEWVRNFSLQRIALPEPNISSPVDWSAARVLIVHAAADPRFALALRAHLCALGAGVTTRAVDGLGAPEEPAHRVSAFTHGIAVMPSGPVPLTAVAVELPCMVALRRSLLTASYEADGVAAFIQFGGGRFGCSDAAGLPASCACLALAATLHLERPELRVRVIDLPGGLAEARALACCLAEISADGPFAIAGYDQAGQRWGLRPKTSAPSAYRPRSIVWSPEAVILVSGGAKGITAECAEAAAAATGAQLALLGSTPLPEDAAPDHAIRVTLAGLEAKGIRACYYTCDLMQVEAVDKAVRRIRSEQGPIRAVIHGAGLNRPRPAAAVSAAEALAEIGPKVTGLLNLWAALADAPPALVVGLSSIIGISGMPGNAWYGFANETMDILLQSLTAESPATQTQAVAFSIWGETGMGARMGSVSRLSRMGIEAIPTREGRSRFTRLFTNDPAAPVVVVTARLGGLDTWGGAESTAPAGRFCRDLLTGTPGVEAVFKTRLRLDRDLYLADHQYNGAYLFPTVFGLEAMAQAASAAAGHRLGLPLQIEDIQLRRPIMVDPVEGSEIVIWAQVQEAGAAGAPERIRAGIRKPDGDADEDCFSATLVLAADPAETAIDVERIRTALPIVPREDLYRESLLFQGDRFQRITGVYVLEGNGCDRGHAELSAERRSDAADQAFAAAQDGPLLLPDPFFSDAMLQSAALLVPQDPCLPVAIGRMSFYGDADDCAGVCRIAVALEDCREQSFLTRVSAVDAQGRPVIQFESYRLKILKHVPEYPTVEALRAPAERDRRLTGTALETAAGHFALNLPEWDLEYIPGIHRLSRQERRWLERPLLEQVAGRACRQWSGASRDQRVIWLDSGKPALDGSAGGTLELSLSHDERLCFATAGAAPQGCDLAPVTRRSRDDWDALLGSALAPLLEESIGRGEPLDLAGTRLWAALEAVRKALGPEPVRLRQGDCHAGAMLFEVCGGRRPMVVLTLALQLTWGPPRILALALDPPLRQAACLPAEAIDPYAGWLGRPAYEVRPEGPRGELVFVQRFPVTFKPGAQLSRNVYFTHYFDWMGHAREASTYPVMRELIDLLGTGRWGSVTNYSRLELFGEARTGDLVQLRMWTSENGGPCDATMTLQYEFVRLVPGAPAERLAFCELQTTWVALTGHGQARPAPYPPVLQAFFANMIPREQAPQPDLSLAAPLSHLHRSGSEPVVYRAAVGPVIEPQLAVHTFETALGQGNAVGNVYYAKYYEWQGMLRDMYLQRLMPDYFGGTGERGEAVCLACRVDHLREAMPFDRIMVRMSLKAWYPQRALLAFDYYRAEEGRAPVKLAWGNHELVWVERDGRGRPRPADFPQALERALQAAVQGRRIPPLPRAAAS